MRRICIFIGLLGLAWLIAPGCKKHGLFMGSATIVGPDPRMAACEGGTYIKIDGHPNPNDRKNGYYDIGALPSSFSSANFSYPTKVRLDWHIDANCSGNYVDITRMEIVN